MNYLESINAKSGLLSGPVVCGTSIVTIDGANIGITDPTVTITVGPGQTLNIINGASLFACGDMWQGIINNGGTVNITNSTVEDAENALFSNTANSIFSCTGSTFNRNFQNVALYNHDFSTSTFTGNTFECTSNLKTPHPTSYEMTDAHFYLENVSALTIGGTNMVANRNTFKDANYGIFANGSNCNIENNSFINIGNNEPNLHQVYAAINGTETGTINTGDLHPNSFENCNTGVLMIGQVNCLTANNTFEKCEYGVGVLFFSFSFL